MRTVDEHLAHILATVAPLEVLDLTLLDAHGCTLAEDVSAQFPMPAFDNSAMDGYIVRVADVAGASEQAPVTLPVVGDIAAGSSGIYSVQPGLCLRIMTGAPVPAGGEAVVPVEWTDGGTRSVSITRAPEPGAFIRRAGEDVVPGTVVVPAGTYLGAAQIGVLAALGRARVRARPRPRVVVLSTGSELVEPGSEVGPGQLPDSNSYTLTSAALEVGAIAFRVGIVPDEPAALADAIEDQLIRADALVTSGGVSVGAYDVVKEVLSRLGTVEFTRVAMQPGMPQGFGVVGPDRTPVFALPGNPVSAFVSFEVFVRPALRRMLAAEPVHRPIVRATLTAEVLAPPGKRAYLRGRLDVRDGAYVVTPVGGAGSHLMSGLVSANCLLIVPEDATAVAAGQPVDVVVLERRHA